MRQSKSEGLLTNKGIYITLRIIVALLVLELFFNVTDMPKQSSSFIQKTNAEAKLMLLQHVSEDKSMHKVQNTTLEYYSW